MLGTSVVALLPVYLFSGLVVATQHIGSLQRSYRDALRDDLTRIIPGGHAALLTNLGAALYHHPKNFFGMGLHTAADLHLVASFGLVGANAFLLELGLANAYQPLPVPPEVALLIHPQIIGVSGLLLLILYVDVRQQFVLAFVTGIAAVYMFPNRGLADAAARLLVITVTITCYAVTWVVLTSRSYLEVIDVTRNTIMVLAWGGQVFVGYGLVFLFREALIWWLWQAVQAKG
jgi:hypothetical protein